MNSVEVKVRITTHTGSKVYFLSPLPPRPYESRALNLREEGKAKKTGYRVSQFRRRRRDLRVQFCDCPAGIFNPEARCKHLGALRASGILAAVPEFPEDEGFADALAAEGLARPVPARPPAEAAKEPAAVGAAG